MPEDKKYILARKEEETINNKIVYKDIILLRMGHVGDEATQTKVLSHGVKY